MRMRLLLVALLGTMLASAKTYQFTLSNPSQAGSTKLNAGEYKVKVEGQKVMLEDAQGREVHASVKLEQAAQHYNFQETEVALSKANGGERIDWIGLGGSKSKIVFQ